MERGGTLNMIVLADRHAAGIRTPSRSSETARAFAATRACVNRQLEASAPEVAEAEGGTRAGAPPASGAEARAWREDA